MNLIIRARLVSENQTFTRVTAGRATRANLSRQTPAAGGFNSWPKALSILARDDERLDHLGFLEVTVELIQLHQPEFVA